MAFGTKCSRVPCGPLNLGPAATFRGRIAKPGADQTLVLLALQRGVDAEEIEAETGHEVENILTISPQFVSGDDLGFRIERTVDGIPIGKLVIRVDGRWVDVAPPPANGSAAQ